LIFLGNKRVSAWAVVTSEGIILIDALYRAKEAELSIEQGLLAVGLDPADIKVLVISHGHGDHYGGAPYLVAKYQPEVIMGQADWRLLENPFQRIKAPGWQEVPTPDTLVADSHRVTLGDTSIDLVVTPSHTPGTLATIIPLRDGKNTHTAVLWGGTGFNFAPNVFRFNQYAESAELMRERVLSDNIDVFLSNHVKRDQSDARIALLNQRQPSQKHPFVLAPAEVAQGFEVFRDCAKGQAAKWLQKNRTAASQ
jgi:metallo-beta-lactamase class B